jgi:antibiotic biosynthesis monooxygenase (ABM) superfamily enzyme
MNNEDQDTQQQPKKLPFWKQLLSVMQASFGVQNKTNKERDFASGSITGFVVAALLFTFVFVMILVTVVSWVLP